MNTTKKRGTAISSDVFKSTLTLNFANGKSLELDVMSLSEDIKLQALLHGVKQKLVDAGAIACDLVTGKSASEEQKYEQVKKVFERLTSKNPSWNAIREGAERQSSFISALKEVTGKPKEEIESQIKRFSPKQLAALRRNPRIVLIMQRIESERFGDNGSKSDELLDTLIG